MRTYGTVAVVDASDTLLVDVMDMMQRRWQNDIWTRQRP